MRRFSKRKRYHVKNKYRNIRKHGKYVFYGISSTLFYLMFQYTVYKLEIRNPFFDNDPVLWYLATYFFTEIIGHISYKKAFVLIGSYGIKGAGDFRAGIRSGEHWIARLIIYGGILLTTNFLLWIVYWISLLFN